MKLITPVHTTFLDIASTALTTIQPGETLGVLIHVTAIQACELVELGWKVPSVLKISPTPGPSLPIKLEAGRAIDLQATFASNAEQEGFGEVHASLKVSPAGGREETVTWSAWISVFKRQTADDPEQLSEELRHRLVQVVNARPRNGHIFLADFVAFFDHFLNIAVPKSIVIMLAQDLMLGAEGLPLSPEILLEIILGNKRFYGIDSLELIPEEECEESDDRFDPLDAREIAL